MSPHKTSGTPLIYKGSIMTMAKIKKIAVSVALILGVIAVDKKFGLSDKIRSTLGV